MIYWFSKFVSQHVEYILFLIFVVSFLESLMIIGSFIPGVLLMSVLGTFVGKGQLSLYHAWISGIIGCLLGDWVSYTIGYFFSEWIMKFSIFKKQGFMLKKIIYALSNYSVISIFLGKILGPTRPLVPMLSGILKITKKTFFFPNLLGCILWPIIYLFPGILTSAVVRYPGFTMHSHYKWVFLLFISSVWIGFWFLFRWYNDYSCTKNNYFFLKNNKKFFLSMIFLFFGIFCFVYLEHFPETKILKELFLKIFL